MRILMSHNGASYLVSFSYLGEDDQKNVGLDIYRN